MSHISKQEWTWLKNKKHNTRYLIPWGQFAQEIGLLSGIEAVKLNQKVYEHTPQAKVTEFLVAILSGAKYLQDISLAAHPLDKDVAVAQAWGQRDGQTIRVSAAR